MTDDELPVTDYTEPLVDRVNALTEDEWSDVERILQLVFQTPRDRLAVQRLTEMFSGIVGSELASAFVWNLSFSFEESPFRDFELSEVAQQRLKRILSVYADFVDDLVAIMIRGERDWTQIGVAVYAGKLVRPTVELTISLLDETRIVVETNARGYARLIKSLAHWLDDVAASLSDDEVQEARDLLAETQSQISEIQSKLTDGKPEA
jgi:hypothetical protein